MTDSPSILEIWQRIDRSLTRFAPTIGRALRPPLVDVDLKSWLQERAAQIPHLAESYAAHDGSKQAGGIFARLPCPTAASFPRAATWLSAQLCREAEKLLLHIGVQMFPIGSLRPVGRPLPKYEREDDEESWQGIVVAPNSGALFAVSYSEDVSKLDLVPLGVTWIESLQALLSDLESGRFETYKDEFRILRLVEKFPRPK